MAVPTLSSIAPTLGHAGGGTAVKAVGTNFRLPPAPPATGPAPTPAPTMSVLVGGRAATNVRVASSTEIDFVAPVGDERNPRAGVAVVVQNLDDNGVPIAGEVATLAAAYTYQRTQLAPVLNDSDFVRLIRTLVLELRRQVIDEVVFSVETDYDDETGDQLNTAKLSKLPALVLDGPDLQENKQHRTRERQQIDKGGGEVVTLRLPATDDLVFNVVGVSDSDGEILNLMATLRLFFTRNRYLYMDRDAADASKGRVRYQLLVQESFKKHGTPNKSNISQFSGTFLVRAFDFEDQPGFTGDREVERNWKVGDQGVTIQKDQTGQSFRTGPGPGEC